MTRILFGHAFAFENVPKMAVAIVANDFDAAPICIRHALYGASDFIVKARPSTARLERVCRLVELCIATTAEITARLFVL